MRRISAPRVAVAAFVLLAGTIGVAGPLAAPASATTFNVTNANDSGAGSLRQALTDAATNPGNDTVVVQAGLTAITLATPISWSGTGTGAVTITGNGNTVNLNGQPAGLVDAGRQRRAPSTASPCGGGGTTGNDTAPVVSEGGRHERSATARSRATTSRPVRVSRLPTWPVACCPRAAAFRSPTARSPTTLAPTTAPTSPATPPAVCCRRAGPSPSAGPPSPATVAAPAPRATSAAA